jgi:hypothetical protein
MADVILARGVPEHIQGTHALHRPSFMLTKPVLGTCLDERFEMKRI